jgi:hypothetical protein
MAAGGVSPKRSKAENVVEASQSVRGPELRRIPDGTMPEKNPLPPQPHRLWHVRSTPNVQTEASPSSAKPLPPLLNIPMTTRSTASETGHLWSVSTGFHVLFILMWYYEQRKRARQRPGFSCSLAKSDALIEIRPCMSSLALILVVTSGSGRCCATQLNTRFASRR